MRLPGSGDGLLGVDKPAGPTSHDVVADARRALGTKRIGHTGTLDPFASGLLVLCVGRATRLVEYLAAFRKSYEAEVRLGGTTATLDTESPVLHERTGWETLTADDIRAALTAMLGPQEQIPPIYSAKKVRGEAAHRRVRRGETVELAPVAVEIHEFELLELRLPLLRVRVTASTGTYIRAMARDLGEALEVGAHLTALRRTRIGPFGVDEALAKDDLPDPAAVAAAWIPPLGALPHLPRLDLDPDEATRLQAGRAVPLPSDVAGDRVPSPGAAVAVCVEDDLLAVAVLEGGMLRPRKVFPRG